MRSAQVLLGAAAVIAVSCGGKVIVDGPPSGGGGGGIGGAGGSPGQTTVTATAAVTGSTGSLSTTATTGSGGPACDPQGCSSDGQSCTCKTTCGGVALAVQCISQGAAGASCVCIKEGNAIAKCADATLDCNIPGSCCSPYFF